MFGSWRERCTWDRIDWLAVFRRKNSRRRLPRTFALGLGFCRRRVVCRAWRLADGDSLQLGHDVVDKPGTIGLVVSDTLRTPWARNSLWRPRVRWRRALYAGAVCGLSGFSSNRLIGCLGAPVDRFLRRIEHKLDLVFDGASFGLGLHLNSP